MSADIAYHNPVMLQECLDALRISPSGVYVDVTFGGGGHSKAILKLLGPDGKLFAFDQDDDVIPNLPNDSRFTWVNHNFRFIKNFLKYYHIQKVDGVLADLGVSSHQFDAGSRGFSYRTNADLDMRMDRLSQPDAQVVLNSYPEDKLLYIFKSYGELRNAYKVVQYIINAREQKPIKTTDDLIELLKPITPFKEKYSFLGLVFQAIRMEVNKELEVLEHFLTDASDMLGKGGRLVVMSYHSLEDRMVKNYIASGNFQGHIEKDLYGNSNTPLKSVGKLIIPSESEIQNNPRSRSAKLRVAEKI